MIRRWDITFLGVMIIIDLIIYVYDHFFFGIHTSAFTLRPLLELHFPVLQLWLPL